MKPHTVKVAIDKNYALAGVTGNITNNFERLISLFSNRVVFVTTFTDSIEHYRILSLDTLKEPISVEDGLLQFVFRKYNVGAGKPIINSMQTGKVGKENIFELPDILCASDDKLVESARNYGVTSLDEVSLQKFQSVKLCVKKVGQFICDNIELPFWKVRIEDRYLIKNIRSKDDANRFFRMLNLGVKHCVIEIIASDQERDYRDWGKKSYKEIQNEIKTRQSFLKSSAKQHEVKFFNKAGHDRYLCTNNSLYILGNSLTSDKETHITYYPLMSYFRSYFNC